ncbi:MAG: cupin domain-containing protein [Myxococcaceae bacterium]|nr:cupin domain-containing protein [Myxococcaceae bacterium]
MSQLIIKKFSSPDARRPFVARGHADILEFEGGTIGLAVFEPGWKWSKDVQPLAGTESCQAPHFCYYLSGRMVVVMDDGTRGELGPGDVAFIPPGHDAWVVGDEPCVMLDFEGMKTYAQAREPARPQAGGEQPTPAVH